MNEQTYPEEDISAYHQLVNTEGLYSMGQVAKAVSGGRTGRNRLYAFLRELRILDRNNVPYQRYMNQGYFCLKVKTDIAMRTSYLVLFATPKGLIFIMKLAMEYPELLYGSEYAVDPEPQQTSA